ncbi:MAG: SIMPL domain-containing protein [Acetatifactor sp.]|nr:SIMPL domain-containing protein [Acetatifactor sp.]
MRTIRITGKGKIKVKPDMTRITMTLEGIYPEYSEALRHSSQDTDCIKEVLAVFGFERSDLKTLKFNVDTEYESYKEKNAFKQRLVGYKFRHQMKVEFESDNDRLGRILYALAHCRIKPEFRISYTVKDQEAAKNKLLGKAVTDAKEKAAVLTQAAGVGLKEIQSIDYSWGEINFEVHPMGRAMLAEDEANSLMAPLSASYDLDIEPDDIEVSDTVTVVWEIQ